MVDVASFAMLTDIVCVSGNLIFSKVSPREYKRLADDTGAVQCTAAAALPALGHLPRTVVQTNHQACTALHSGGTAQLAEGSL